MRLPCDRREALSAFALVMAAAVMVAPGEASAAEFSAAAPPAAPTLATGGAALPPAAPVDYGAILQKATKKAVGGGKAGAAAAVAQVTTLMWLRTLMNYQYRYGGTLNEALATLWAEGGVARLYQGFPFALVQGPASRFGDTAANAFVLALLADVNVDVGLKTVACSGAAALWRIGIMPVDTVKTTLQVQGGAAGLAQLTTRLAERGPGTLYEGALATSAATFVGHYPWFATYNYLAATFPPPPPGSGGPFAELAHNAGLGLCASLVSDTCSNSLRVVKTTKQTAEEPISYPAAVAKVLSEGGPAALFGRGLATRFLTNGLQGMLFSVLWKYFERTLNAGGG